VTNIGSRPTDGSPITISDTLPASVTAEEARLTEIRDASPTNAPCGVTACTYNGVLLPGDILELHVVVSVPLGAPEGPITNTVVVTGGGAPQASVSAQNAIGVTPAPFALKDFAFGLPGLDGMPDTQAAGHPYGNSTTFDLTNQIVPESGQLEIYSSSQAAKDTVVDLPVGFAGSALAVPRCPLADLEQTNEGSRKPICPADTEVGNVTLHIINAGSSTSSEAIGNSFPLSPVYNLVPERGYAAEFGFTINQIFKTHLFARLVHTTAGYVLRVTSPDIPSEFLFAKQGDGALAGASVTLFGDPEREDASGYTALVGGGGGQPAPFFTNPSDCSGEPLTASLHLDTWSNKGRVLGDGEPDFSDPNWLGATAQTPAVSGCEALRFDPSFAVSLDNARADAPVGFSNELRIPQAPNEDFALATPDMKSTSVALPAGLALSPAAADGLQACTEAQLDIESEQPASCPAASQIGTVTGRTPSLGEELEGQVFLAAPECGPCTVGDAQAGRVARLFLQLQAPASGIVIKVPGSTSIDPATGALTASFEDLPQQPLEDLRLSLKSGPRAPLATQMTCGLLTANTTITPWSAPQSGPPATPSSSFEVNSGCAFGFAPSFTAGTSNNQAGAFSPLSVTFSRSDQEQDLGGVTVTTPPGLLGILKGVERCPEPQAAQGACGQGSLIGHASGLVGAGSHPFYAQGGQVFLTGPYKGAPFGLSIVVPAVAGPFNLGNVVVRAAIQVDPHTAQITVTSDPLPTMVDGIPLQVKTVNVAIDRQGFMFNPTDCDPLAMNGTLTSTQGASAAVSSHFQAANCAALPFKPVFSVSTQAKTSKQNGASLTVKGTFPAGEANIRGTAVVLPKQLPARLTTIQQACPEATFAANPATCPTGSMIGVATASTPILANPVTGPTYLVSHGGAAFPDVVAVLQGEGVTVDLTGSVNIKKGITSSDFATVPDAPIGNFQLTLPEGPHSGLAAVLPAKAKGNMCGTSLTMPFTITGQNNAQLKQNEKIQVTGCPAPKKKGKAKPKKQGGKR
jgi:hypothetical protein